MFNLPINLPTTLKNLLALSLLLWLKEVPVVDSLLAQTNELSVLPNKHIFLKCALCLFKTILFKNK